MDIENNSGSRPLPEPESAEGEQWVETRRRSKRRASRKPRSAEEIRAQKRRKRKDSKKNKAGHDEIAIVVSRKDGSRGVKRIRFAPGAAKTLKVPEVFSFLDAPEATAAFLDQLAILSGTRSVKHLSLQAKNCHKIGLDALVGMSVIILRAKRRRKNENPLSVSGTWPDDLPMQIMFKASGIPHHLGLPEAKLSPEHEKLVHRCELFDGKAVKKRYAMARQRNEATENLRKYFDRCLNTVGFTLTRPGKAHLDKLISEVIGNAEEHGGPWYTIGHWQLGDSDEDRRYGVCHIAMFNFGNSIYESFLTPDASPTIVEQLRSLSDLHTKRGWFDRLKGTWDEQTLWTLYAMQERVSRFSGLSGQETRGNGTRDIVEFFSELGNPGNMCVVSGQAYILFDGTYGFKDINVDGETLKVITFNKSGSLEDPPEREYVRRLPKAFPGTMISVRLTLDEQFLTRLAGYHND